LKTGLEMRRKKTARVKGGWDNMAVKDTGVATVKVLGDGGNNS
jgi:hypothetical protein